MPTYRHGYRSGTRRSPTGYHPKPKHSGTGWSYSPTMFNNLRKELQWRICSYRTLNQQFSGVGKVTAFSPTLANRWLKWVNDGARVYKFSNPDFCKYFGKQWYDATPNAAFRWMKQKYGPGIKGVTRGKANNWLIAATTNFTARPFSNYNWH